MFKFGLADPDLFSLYKDRIFIMFGSKPKPKPNLGFLFYHGTSSGVGSPFRSEPILLDSWSNPFNENEAAGLIN
jgi:hypothetical protein